MNDYYYEANDLALFLDWKGGDGEALNALVQRHERTVLQALDHRPGSRTKPSPVEVWMAFLGLSRADLVHDSVEETLRALCADRRPEDACHTHSLPAVKAANAGIL